MSDTEIVFTAPQTAALLPLPPNDTPLEPDEVIGQTLASVISAGTELALYTRDDPSGFPFRPGYASIFEVTAVGAEVRDFQPGDRALRMGSHRSRHRDRQSNLVKVPADLAPAEAAFARLMSVSMTTLMTTSARPGQPVLVTGLGPVGHLAAKLFAASGYRVIGCDPVAWRRELLNGITGIETRADIHFEDSTLAEHIALVVECSGHEKAALDGCKMVRKGGEVVLVGVPWRRRADDLWAHDILHAVFHRYAILRSGWEWELPRFPTDFAPGSIQESLTLSLDWLAAGRISVANLYETIAPANAQTAYTRLLRQETTKLATVFDWR